MKLVKNQTHSMILMKIFIFIGESKIHAGLCPFHHRKWHVFDGFGVKYMNVFDVLCPWAVVQWSRKMKVIAGLWERHSATQFLMLIPNLGLLLSRYHFSTKNRSCIVVKTHLSQSCEQSGPENSLSPTNILRFCRLLA